MLQFHHGSQPPKVALELAIMNKTGRGGYNRGGHGAYYTSSDADHTPPWISNSRSKIPPWNQHLDSQGRGTPPQAARQSRSRAAEAAIHGTGSSNSGVRRGPIHSQNRTANCVKLPGASGGNHVTHRTSHLRPMSAKAPAANGNFSRWQAFKHINLK